MSRIIILNISWNYYIFLSCYRKAELPLYVKCKVPPPEKTIISNLHNFWISMNYISVLFSYGNFSTLFSIMWIHSDMLIIQRIGWKMSRRIFIKFRECVHWPCWSYWEQQMENKQTTLQKHLDYYKSYRCDECYSFFRPGD